MLNNKQLIWGLLMITLAVTSCSKGADEITESGIRYGMPKPSYTAKEIPSLMCSFCGTWMVDEVSADTTDVRVATAQSTTTFQYSNFVEFYGFPFKEMMKRMLPEVKVAKITCETSDGMSMSDDAEALYSILLAKHENAHKQCLLIGVGQALNCVGISEKTLYLEFALSSFNSELYLPFVVTTDEGKQISVTAFVQLSLSKAVLATDGSSFTCTLTVPYVEYTESSEPDAITKELRLESEMKLKYISIKRIEYPLSGN